MKVSDEYVGFLPPVLHAAQRLSLQGVEAMFNWEITVFDIMIEGLIVSAIWQYLSYRASKRHEKHLQAELDELYNKLIEARDEAKEAKEKADE